MPAGARHLRRTERQERLHAARDRRAVAQDAAQRLIVFERATIEIAIGSRTLVRRHVDEECDAIHAVAM
jgi:hypothetical protein